MNFSLIHPEWHRRGFTLVELLVAMAVLAIMLLMLGKAISYVSTIWLNGIGFLDNYTKARDILTIMDRDIQEMVLRPDTAAFVDASGNPACAFYTNVQGNPGSDTRTVSLVQYLLNPAGGTDVNSVTTLARLNLGMNYGGTTPVLGTTLNPTPTELTQLPAAGNPNSNANVDALAVGVLRFEWQFVDGAGDILTPPYTPVGSSPSVSTPFSYNFTLPGSSSNPRLIVLSIVVLSNAASQLATQSATVMSKLLADFPASLPASGANMTYSQYWDGILNPTTGNFDASLPATVRGGLEVFTRSVALPVQSP